MSACFLFGLRAQLLYTGFELRQLSYFNSILLPVVAAARLATRLLPLSGRTDIGRTPPALNSAWPASKRY